MVSFYFSIYDETYGSSPTGSVRRVVIINGVCVKQLPSIIGVVTQPLKPHGEVFIVQSLTDKLRIATYEPCKQVSWLKHGSHTIGWNYVGYIRVMRRLPRP